MEFRVLEYFLAIARERSFSKAAQQLHITQPTLSRQIADLERELGRPLFVRGGKELALTEGGLFLLNSAKDMLALRDRTKMGLAGDAEKIFGDVYIGGAESAGMRLVARTIKKAHDKYPHIKFHLFSGNAEAVLEKLEKGLIDFGVLVHSKGTDQYVNIDLGISDRFGILMRSDDPMAAKESVALSDVLDKPLIVSAQDGDWNLFGAPSFLDVAKEKAVASYNLLYNASLLVREGVGYCLCLENIVNTEGTDLLFKPLTPRVEVRLTAVHKKYQTFSRAAGLFMDLLKKEIEDGGTEGEEVRKGRM